MCYNGYSSSSGGYSTNLMITTSQNTGFGQTSKFTDLFKVPGLADGNGSTMYDATSDLAF